MHNLTYLDIKILSRKKAGNSIRFCIIIMKRQCLLFFPDIAVTTKSQQTPTSY